MKKSVKKYQDAGSTTRKNLLGRTVKETYKESFAPSFSDDRRISTSNYTKEVYRKDGTPVRRKETSSANRSFDRDITSKVTKFNKQGDVKSVKGGTSKNLGYKKGGSVKSKKK